MRSDTVNGFRLAHACKPMSQEEHVRRTFLAPPHKALPPDAPRPRPRPRVVPVRTLPFAPTARRLGSGGAVLVLWLPRVPRAVEGSNGRSWKVKSRATKEWHQLVAAALKALGQPGPSWFAATLSYSLYRARGRAHDPDNVIGLMKPVQDAIVAAGVLPGDTEAHVLGTPTAVQHLSPLPFGFVVVWVTRADPATTTSGGGDGQQP